LDPKILFIIFDIDAPMMSVVRRYARRVRYVIILSQKAVFSRQECGTGGGGDNS
jgi:hypothetical protein